MKDKLVVIGAGGHGRVIADAALGIYEHVFFLDDDVLKIGKKFFGCAVAGVISSRAEYKDNCDFVVAIGDNRARAELQSVLIQEGFSVVSIVHRSAVIGRDVTLGNGVVILANAVVNTGAVIGDGAIINTAASVDHDCNIGAFTHVSPGAVLAGGVKLGACSWVCTGASVINYRSICEDCVIGAGAVVISDISEPGIYVGVPAKQIKGKQE